MYRSPELGLVLLGERGLVPPRMPLSCRFSVQVITESRVRAHVYPAPIRLIIPAVIYAETLKVWLSLPNCQVGLNPGITQWVAVG